MAKVFAKDAVERAVEAALAAIGVEGVGIIKRNVEAASAPSAPGHNATASDTGRLADSIQYSTTKIKPKIGGRAKSGVDEITQPTEPLTLYLGTGCPYAPCIEYGTNYGTSSKGHGGVEGGSFRDRIKAWAARHGIEEKYVSAIINSIIRRGWLPARPFMQPSEQEVSALAKRMMDGAMAKIVDGLRNNRKEVINVTLSMTGTHVRSK